MASDFVQYFSGPNLGKDFYQKKITAYKFVKKIQKELTPEKPEQKGAE